MQKRKSSDDDRNKKNTFFSKSECWILSSFGRYPYCIWPIQTLKNVIILYLLIQPYCAFVKVVPIAPWQLNVI